MRCARRLVVVIVVLCGLTASTLATVVYQAGFETLPLGSIGSGVGTAANQVDGRWRDMGTVYTDPTVENTIVHSGSQALQISRPVLGATSVGWTTGGAVPNNTLFEASCWVNKVAGGGVIIWTNNYDYNYQAVSLYVRPDNGALYGLDMEASWSQTSATIANDAWTGIKAVVTNLDDGTGKGFYDVYVNTGSGWVPVLSNVGFISSRLINGVNSFTVDPQGTNNAVVSYIDDVAITYVPEPMTIAILGLGGLVVARRNRK